MHNKPMVLYVPSNLNNTATGGGGIGATDGTAGAAKFYSIKGLVERAGNIYVTDSNNGIIRKISNRIVATMSMSSFRSIGVAMNAGFLFGYF